MQILAILKFLANLGGLVSLVSSWFKPARTPAQIAGAESQAEAEAPKTDAAVEQRLQDGTF